MKNRPEALLILSFLVVLASCTTGAPARDTADESIIRPSFLELDEMEGGGWRAVSVSPFDGSRDTLLLEEPLRNIIAMSTSYIGFLDAIGCRQAVSGVSGARYVFPASGDTTAPTPVDVGYESAPDYERIMALKPGILLTYQVSGVKSRFISRLEDLGIRVFTVNEHLEHHPLARAAYIRLFGALCGNMPAADSVLSAVTDGYLSVRDSIARALESGKADRKKVLLNIPYKDQWFVPSADNYLSRMIRDAGGEVLGSRSGSDASSVIPLEKACALGMEADCWMNVGWCTTLEDLESVNPMFSSIVKEAGCDVWNDNKRISPAGGNDIWQSGVARPDLVLRDLAAALHPEMFKDTTIYYRKLR